MVDMRGVITELKRFATHDGPGIRTTVFLKGCPLRCVWCSNPETFEMRPQLYFKPQMCNGCARCLDACPKRALSIEGGKLRVDRFSCDLCGGAMQCVDRCYYGALERVGRVIEAKDVVDAVWRDHQFYATSGGGVTLSGGEPLHQPEFAEEILKLSKELGIHTALDTSAYAKPDIVERILEYVDLVLLSIKHMDPVKHKEYTGVSNEVILTNAKNMARKRLVRISLPLIPDHNDSEDNLRRTAEFAKSIGVNHIDIEPLHKLGEHKYHFLGLKSPYTNLRSPTNEEVLAARRLLEEYGLETTIGRMM